MATIPKDSLSFVNTILFQRDILGLATVEWSDRILAMTYACGMTVLISTYTATLTAENFNYEDVPEFKHGDLSVDLSKRLFNIFSNFSMTS